MVWLFEIPNTQIFHDYHVPISNLYLAMIELFSSSSLDMPSWCTHTFFVSRFCRLRVLCNSQRKCVYRTSSVNEVMVSVCRRYFKTCQVSNAECAVFHTSCNSLPRPPEMICKKTQILLRLPKKSQKQGLVVHGRGGKDSVLDFCCAGFTNSSEFCRSDNEFCAAN